MAEEIRPIEPVVRYVQEALCVSISTYESELHSQMLLLRHSLWRTSASDKLV